MDEVIDDGLISSISKKENRLLPQMNVTNVIVITLAIKLSAPIYEHCIKSTHSQRTALQAYCTGLLR